MVVATTLRNCAGWPASRSGCLFRLRPRLFFGKALRSLSFHLGRWPTSALVGTCAAFLLCIGFPNTRADVVWEQGAGFRRAPLAPAQRGRTGFTLLPPGETGVLFTNVLSEQKHLTNQIMLNGSGLALGDVDGDGLCDIYLCRLDGANALFRNRGGWKFEEIAPSSGVACENLVSTGCAFADLDGDGDLDLIVNTLGRGTHIFFNDGKAHFIESTFSFNQGRGGMSIALGDLNQDGYLDVYIANYRTLGLMDIPNARATFKKLGNKTIVETFDGRSTASPELTNRFVVGPRGSIDEQGEPDLVLLNQHGTNFSALPISSFLDENGHPLASDGFEWGLSAMIRDVNGDGLPDIYVCNDFQTEDRFWINQGGGKFRLLPRLAQRKTSLFSMAVDFADINRDGHDDFFVADMLSRKHPQRMRDLPDGTPPLYQIGIFDDRPQYSMNTLFLNRGDGSYSEIAQLSGLDASEWSWSCIFLDVDLDGWEDLLISNGNERGARDLDVADRMKRMRAARRMSDAEIFQARRMFPRLATANLAFRNLGNLKFEETSTAWGFDLPGVSHGMALADLDNDGDLDVVINNMNAPAAVYRNETAAPRIAVRLKGAPPNTRGVGATITVSCASLPTQSQQIVAGGRYLSSDDAIRTFAIATNQTASIEVKWPDKRRTLLASVEPNYLYEIDEAAAVAAKTQSPASPRAPLFEDASALVPFTHAEIPFDDYARQPLLTKKLSQLGPGIAWFDLNGDGHDDLILGNGKGAPLGVFLNGGSGTFRRVQDPPFNQALTRDVLGLIGWASSSSQRTVLVATANYEDALGSGAAVLLLSQGEKSAREIIGADESSVGPIAMADVDGDGDLDLFVGGRVIAGSYPVSASSRLFRNEGGKFVPDAVNSALLRQVGLVSAAIFTDLDADGDADLLLACEWGPLKLFRNERGVFKDVTAACGLAKYTGWWNGVAVGDFDEDGRLDIVASNWGQNTPYEHARREPLRIDYGDFDSDGIVDLVESHFDADLKKYVPEKQLGVLGKSLSFLRQRFSSNEAYSTAGVEDVLGLQSKRATTAFANWLETTVFLNRGDYFEPAPLPIEAQFAPAFGLCVGDFDGDTHEDIFLAQNFFAVAPDVPRYDGGRGLLLKGNGKGGFQAVSGQESGLEIYGEQRGAAAGDYDEDGRLDLAVAQNGAALKLYHNRGAAPGLRVKLQGGNDNPAAIGARLRLTTGERSGPMRELHSSSGNLSQDSATLIFAGTKPGDELTVIWPGGVSQKVAIPAARELTIRHEAAVPKTQ